MFKNTLTFLLSSLLLWGCKENTNKIENKVFSPDETAAESKKANQFFDAAFDEYVSRSPMTQTYLGIKTDYTKLDDISPENEKREIDSLSAKLANLKKNIFFDKLDEQTQLSYRLFEYGANLKIEGYKYQWHNYPVNQMFGTHADLPAFMINIHIIKDSNDAKAYIARLSAFDEVFTQLIKNLQIREEKGIIAPKFVFPMVISDCKNILKGMPFEKTSKDKSTLLEDFTNKVEGLKLSPTQALSLIKSAEIALLQSVQPAYVKLIAYLNHLETKADTRDGVWKFADGYNYYKYALKATTTTDLTPDQIYATGLSEVARIHEEMRGVMKQVNFKGDSLQSFFKFMKNDPQFYFPNTKEGKKQYLATATAIIDTMRTHLDDLFLTKPKAAIIVKAVEPFREQSAGTAFYQDPAPDGSRPGIYYVNLFNMTTAANYEMEALAYHEGIPGHHMQLSIAQELTPMPKFRKYGGYYIGYYTAYVEGWALYSEQLGKEIGFYKDPYSNFGRLSMELWRACRLVVDVGLHGKKWTREQAIKYLQDNTSASDLECRKSIERYIVMPSQATAYKVGMMKIIEVRNAAKAELKDKFDIREFHDVVLKYGSVPLDILQENVQLWVKRKQSDTAGTVK